MWRQAHYRAVVETALDAIVVIDGLGIIQSSNPAAERIFGYSGDEMIGQSIALLVPSDHGARRGAGEDWRMGVSDSRMIEVGRGLFGRRKNGGLFAIEPSVVRWVADDGQVFFSATLRDVAAYRAAQDPLPENQQWLRTVSETELAGLVVIDCRHRIRFANRAYPALFNLMSQDLAGFHVRDVLPEIYETVLRPRLDAALSGLRQSHDFVYPSVGDVRPRHLAETYEPGVSSAGDPVAVVVVMDVTELKRNEIALRASRDLLQSVLDGTLDAIFAKDSRGRYVAINESGANLIGVSRDAVIGYSDAELRAPGIATSVMAHDRAVVSSGAPTVAELTLVIGGTPTNFLVSKRPWVGPDGSSGGVVGIARDVTEQRLIAAERKDIAKRLMRAQEAARLRLAREIHDEVGQDLTGLSLGLKDLESLLSPEEASSRLSLLRRATDQIARNLHRMARELRPTSLEDLGLRGALASHIAEWQAHFGVTVDTVLDELDDFALGSDEEIAIYRCVQECLTNVVKHADATSVSVVAQCTGSHVRIVVEDNGAGFDAEDPPLGDIKGRLGMLGMRERMSHVDGTLTVESAPGRGTSVFLSLAVKRERGA